MMRCAGLVLGSKANRQDYTQGMHRKAETATPVSFFQMGTPVDFRCCETCGSLFVFTTYTRWPNPLFWLANNGGCGYAASVYV